MNETVLLSNEYISKEMFEEEIKISGYHFETAGDDDELWLINDKTNKSSVKISLVNHVNGIYRYTDNPSEILEGVKMPYEGIIYFIEYNDSKIMKQISDILNIENRKLYALNESSSKFVEIK